MQDLIVVERLTKNFGALCAVDAISLTVPRGQVLGFLGPNGAGKSTTMKMITGFMRPSSGTAAIAGHDIQAAPIAAKKQLGYLPEGAPAYADMQVYGFLHFIAQMRGYKGKGAAARVDAALSMTELREVAGQTIDTLSKGYKRRVGLAQALLHDPDVLILDEPTDGLDPNQKHEVRALIRQLAPQKAIIISTHILEEVDALCQQVAVIAKGRLLANETPQDFHRRAPDYNALSFSITAEQAALILPGLEQIRSIKHIERQLQANGEIYLRLLPAAKQTILAPVLQLLEREGISAKNLLVEEGRLDEAFRSLTKMPETSKTSEMSA
jgi:ABC-2 type transport system ATP-binding protein